MDRVRAAAVLVHLRADVEPFGVRSNGDENASARQSTLRPPSAGRPSSQYAVPSSSHGWLRRTLLVANAAAVIGDDHEPMGDAHVAHRERRPTTTRVTFRSPPFVLATSR